MLITNKETMENEVKHLKHLLCLDRTNNALARVIIAGRWEELKSYLPFKSLEELENFKPEILYSNTNRQIWATGACDSPIWIYDFPISELMNHFDGTIGWKLDDEDTTEMMLEALNRCLGDTCTVDMLGVWRSAYVEFFDDVVKNFDSICETINRDIASINIYQNGKADKWGYHIDIDYNFPPQPTITRTEFEIFCEKINTLLSTSMPVSILIDGTYGGTVLFAGKETLETIKSSFKTTLKPYEQYWGD